MASIYRVPSLFSQNIPGYLQVKKAIKQFLLQKEEAKGVLNSQEYKLGKNCLNIILKYCIS